MSNNSAATLEGGEIGRAQAAQAEACGLRPVAEMNPILLKPAGAGGCQLIVLGETRDHLAMPKYYNRVDELWQVVRGVLDAWRARCDLLILEGAGSPVELNLAACDLVNLRPAQYLGARWLLVGDIERGGVFAQLVGTWRLMTAAQRALGLGLVVNKFRGDPALFAGAGAHLRAEIGVPLLGTVPYADDLQPESEDSLCREAEEGSGGEPIGWVRFPHLSNSSDAQPWRLDAGVAVRWVTRPGDLANVRALVLPGTKNTVADLRWLHATGLGAEIVRRARAGLPVAGLCGGYQMLGRRVADPGGVDGEGGNVAGLGLLPLNVGFAPVKRVVQVEAHWGADRWQAYEIHMGRACPIGPVTPLLTVCEGGGAPRPEGMRVGNVWGTHLHGLFESGAVRAEFAALARIGAHRASRVPWREHCLSTYDAMADHLARHVDLEPVRRHVED